MKPIKTWHERTQADKWTQETTTYMQSEIDDLRQRCAEVERGLADAAQSLETVASLSGRKSYGMPPIETYMETFMEVRAYAAARAGVAREVIDDAISGEQA